VTDYYGEWQGTVYDTEAPGRALMSAGSLDGYFAPVAARDSPMPHPFTINWVDQGSRGRWQEWPGTAWPSGNATYPRNDPDYLRGYSYLLGHDSTQPGFEDGNYVVQQLILDNPLSFEGSSNLHPAFELMPDGAVGVDFALGAMSRAEPLEVHAHAVTMQLIGPSAPPPGVGHPWELVTVAGDYADIDLVSDHHGLLPTVPARVSWNEVATGTVSAVGAGSLVEPGVVTFSVDPDDLEQLILLRGTSDPDLNVIVSNMAFTRVVTWDDYRYIFDAPQGNGMWTRRQRQTLSGNTGGWPLRQRHNGGATGSWPLRQRQAGA